MKKNLNVTLLGCLFLLVPPASYAELTCKELSAKAQKMELSDEEKVAFRECISDMPESDIFFLGNPSSKVRKPIEGIGVGPNNPIPLT